MARLRRLTGRELLRILHAFGFRVARTRGSHATLVRTTASGERRVLTVPTHRRLALGMAHAAYRRARRFIPDAELRSLFFAD